MKYKLYILGFLSLKYREYAHRGLAMTNNDKGKKLRQVDTKIHALSVEQLNDLVLGAKIGILETG